jgi:hypothetical protein
MNEDILELLYSNYFELLKEWLNDYEVFDCYVWNCEY